MTARMEKFELLIDGEAKSLISELKTDYQTYGDIIEVLNTTYGGSSYNSVIGRARVLMKEEISNIPLKEKLSTTFKKTNSKE